jgi:predicted RNase H-like nuclease (RuvC/YqgF family)
MTGSVALVVGLASALISPLIAYVVATRRLSGKVSTSEASELWKESSSIREDYRDRLRYSDEQLRRLESRISALEESNNELREENHRLRKTCEALTRENEALHEQVNGIQKKVNGA